MESLPIIIGLAAVVFCIIAEWKVYTKAGQPGWACIVPIYGTLVMLEIIGKPWWWLFFLCIPGFNIFILIKIIHLLSLSFGKTAGFTVGLIFLSPVFMAILGFGSAVYQGPAGQQA